MAGQFLNEDDNTVSSPPIVPPVNAGSSATGEPKGKAPVAGSFIDDTAPSPAPGNFIDDSPSASQGQFLPAGKDDAPLSAGDIHSLVGQGWKPWTDEHFRTLYADENQTKAQTPFLTKVGQAASGVVSPFLKAGSEIAAVKPDWKTHARAKRIFASIPEGIVGAAHGLAGLIGMPVAEDVAAGQVPLPGGSYVRAALQTPEEKYQAWYLNYLAQHPEAEAQPDTTAPAPGVVTPNWIRGGVEPLPQLSQAIGTVASFALPEAAGAGASKLASTSLLRPLVDAGELAKNIPAAAARAAYEATDLSKSVPIGTVAGAFPKLQAAASNLIPAAGVTGRAVSKLGDLATTVGEAPEKIIGWGAGKILGSDVAEKMAEKLGAYELPVAGAAFVLGEPAIAAVITGLKGIAKAGPVISGFGRYMERLAQADPGQFGKLYTLARDQSAPSWMQAASSHAAVKALASAGDIAKSLGVSAAHGAAFGAAIGALPGQEFGANIGGGLGYGLIGGGMYQGRMKEARILQRDADANLSLYNSHVAEGISPDSLKKVGTDAWTWASTMEQVLGGETKIRFAGEKDAAMPPAVYGQAGMYDPATKTVWVNTDANRPTSDTLLHEIMHPIFEGAINEHPELGDQVNKALASEGYRIADAKQTYVSSLMAKSLKDISDPVQRQAAIAAKIKDFDATSQQNSGSPDTWMHSEILAEAGAKSLYGTHPVIDVTNPSFTDTVLQYAQTAFEKMGITFKQSESGKTILPGFENVVASPVLRRAVYRLIKERKNLVPNAEAGEPRGVPLTPKVWGQHPGATLETRADGTTGNDFVLQKPDGRIVERPNREVKKIVGNRRKEMNALYPVSDNPLPSSDQSPGIATRKTPSGLTERSGVNLGPGFDSLTTVGAKTKANAHAIEQAIADGTSMQGWYQQIGKESGAGDWKASVQKDTGAIEAQHKEFIPINFLVDKQSNLLVRNYSLTAFDRKAAAWAARSGPVSLDEFGGDVGKFKEAVAQYLKNHDEGLPGDASGVGSAKRDIINAFLVGGNRTFEAKNPLRPLLKGADRQGVVRSYRLDRLETLDKGDSTLAQPDYSKQVQNMSPAQAKSRAKKKSLFAETSALTSKGWILPNSEFVPLQGELHSGFLLSKADALKKAFGVDFSKYPDTDADEGPRIPALNKGFARVNYERNTGTLTIEANHAHWSKATRDAVFSLVADNAAKIDNIKVALLDDKANVKKYDSSQLFQYDDQEKLEHIPFVSESSSGRRMSPDTGSAARLSELSNKTDRTPAEDEEFKKLTAQSNANNSRAAFEAQWKKSSTSPQFSPDTNKKKIEIEGPDGTKYPAYFDGHQDFSALGMGKVPQITPLVDIPGTAALSTTYGTSLEKRGFKLPDLSQFSPDTKPNEAVRKNAELQQPDLTESDVQGYATEVADKTLKEGGTTFNIAEGKPIGKSKTFGVSIYPERSVVLNRGDVTAARVAKFIKDNADLLRNSDNCVGTWYDKDSGKVYLDVSVGLKDRAFAKYVGDRTNQKALWDSEKGTEIPLTGTGEAVAGLPPAATRLDTLRAAWEKRQSGSYSPYTSGAMTDSGKELLKKHDYTLEDKAEGFGTGMVNLMLTDNKGKQIGSLYAHQTSPTESSVDSVKVNNNLQGKGIGEVLYRELAARLQQAGVTTLDGNVVHPAPLKIREKLFGAPLSSEEAGQTAWGGQAYQVKSTIDPNKVFSPDLDKKIEKMPSIHADEMPEETAYYWMKQNGQLIPVASHDGAAAKLGVGVDDLYSNGLLRVAVRAEEGTNKSVWLNSHDIAIPTPKQRQAIEALKDRGFQVSDGSTGSAMSPDQQPEMFSKQESNPQGERAENVKDESILYPERELSPIELTASNLARKELRDRVQVLPDADERVKLRRALNRGFIEVSQSLEKQASDKNFDTGADWYRKDLEAMEDTTKKIFPETKDATKMSVFKALVAALSPSAKPGENYRSAAEAFAQYLKTGKFPYTTPYRVSETGKRRQLGLTAESSMGKMNELLKQAGGEKQLIDYLLTKHDVTVYGNKEAYGALDLGPKLGRFLLNLSGHGDEVTVDMWATRTFNRWMGTPFRKQAGRAELPDIPTEQERNVMIDAFTQIGETLSKSTGVPMTAMDVQAVLWYFEKDLYAKTSKAGRLSFSEAAKAYEAKPLHTGPRQVTTAEGRRVEPTKAQPDLLTKAKKKFPSAFSPDFGFVGGVDDGLSVSAAAGKLHDITHDSEGLYEESGASFRYNQRTKTLYWWRGVSADKKNAAEAWLKKKGFEVKKHVKIVVGGDTYLDAHGQEFNGDPGGNTYAEAHGITAEEDARNTAPPAIPRPTIEELLAEEKILAAKAAKNRR